MENKLLVEHDDDPSLFVLWIIHVYIHNFHFHHPSRNSFPLDSFHKTSLDRMTWASDLDRQFLTFIRRCRAFPTAHDVFDKKLYRKVSLPSIQSKQKKTIFSMSAERNGENTRIEACWFCCAKKIVKRSYGWKGKKQQKKVMRGEGERHV